MSSSLKANPSVNNYYAKSSLLETFRSECQFKTAEVEDVNRHFFGLFQFFWFHFYAIQIVRKEYIVVC